MIEEFKQAVMMTVAPATADPDPLRLVMVALVASLAFTVGVIVGIWIDLWGLLRESK